MMAWLLTSLSKNKLEVVNFEYLRSIAYSNQKVWCCMDAWIDGRAGLRIAYSNKKCQLLHFGHYIVGRFGLLGGSASRPKKVQF